MPMTKPFLLSLFSFFCCLSWLLSQSYADESYINEPGPTNLLSLAVSDINGDNKNDIIVGGSGEYNFYYKLNLGNNNFSVNMPIEVQSKFVYNIEDNDFNGDNLIDLLIIHSNDEISNFTPPFFQSYNFKISILFNDGQGAFQDEIEIYQYEGFVNIDIWAFDNNNDGLLDFVHNENIFINQSSGVFTLESNLPGYLSWNGTNSFWDLNNDGFIDLIRENNSLKTIFPGNQSGFESDSFNVSLNQAESISGFGDLNNDNLIDFVTYNNDSESYKVYLNTLGFTFTNNYEIPDLTTEVPQSIKIIDLNSDSLNDIFIENSFSNSLHFVLSNDDGFENKTDVYFGDLYLQNVFSNYELSDLDNNGLIDFVFIMKSYNSGIFLSSNISNENEDFYLVDFRYQILDLADINGDNKLDLTLVSRFRDLPDIQGVKFYYYLEGSESNCFQNTFKPILENGNFEAVNGELMRTYLNLNDDSFTDALDIDFNQTDIRLILKLNNLTVSFNAIDTLLVPFDQPFETLPYNFSIPIVYTFKNNDSNELEYIMVYCQAPTLEDNDRFIGISYDSDSGFNKIFDWAIPTSVKFHLMPTKSLSAVDIDFDGDKDFIYKNRNNENIYIVENVDSNAFALRQTINLCEGITAMSVGVPRICKVADLDNDGELDIVANCFSEGASNLYFCKGIGNFNFAEPEIIDLGITGLVSDIILKDINNNNLIDIIVRYHDSYNSEIATPVIILLNNSSNNNFNYSAFEAGIAVADGNYDGLGVTEVSGNDNIFLFSCSNENNFDIILSDCSKTSYFNYETITNNLSLFENDNQATVYPNPTQNSIIINGLENDNFNYSVYSCLGKLMLFGVYHSSDAIDLSNLSSGIYFLQLENESTNYYFKINKAVK